MAESDIQEKILKYLKANSMTKVDKIHSGSTNGIADILVCHYGRYIAIEVKDEGRRPEPDAHQALWLNGVIRAGGQAICTNTLDDVIRVLRDTSYGRVPFKIPGIVKFEGML